MSTSDTEFRSQLNQRLQRYTAQINQLMEQIEELEGAREDLVGRRKNAEELYLAEFGEVWTDSASGSHETVVADTHSSGPFTGLGWAAAIVYVLTAAGQPLHVKEIWDRLREGGFKTEARDPLRSIVAIAVRSHSLAKVGPNIYGLQAGGGEKGQMAAPMH